MILALNWLIALTIKPQVADRATVPYSVFRAQAQEGNIAEVSSKGSTIQGTFRLAQRYPPKKQAPDRALLQDRAARVRRRSPARPAAGQAHDRQCQAGRHRPVAAGDDPCRLPADDPHHRPVHLADAARCGRRRRDHGQRRASKARRYDATHQRTTFADVAGIDEATEELAEVVDFLKHPDAIAVWAE